MPTQGLNVSRYEGGEVLDEMDMKDQANTAGRGWIAHFLRSRAGSIAPLFAVAAIPLTIAIGAATDIGRMMDIRSQMQDMSDSAALAGATQFTQTSNAAAVSTAEAFVKAAILTLPGAPTPSVYASCGTPTGAGTGVIVANVCDLGTTTNGTTITAQIKVMMAGDIATTFGALVTKSVSVSTQSVASGNIGRNVVFTLTNYNSSASDTDQIYYYSIPNASVPGAGASNSSLLTYYTWTPTLTASNLLLSNTTGFSNVSQTVQIPLNTTVGFALSNTTGTTNCYGQAMKANKMYYSHREDSNGSYWDIAPASFNICTSDTSTITNYNTYLTTDSSGNNLLMPCKSGNSCVSSATYNSGSRSSSIKNYVYYTDTTGAYSNRTGLSNVAYNRNPLRYASTNTDCTQGDVMYQWDDNGGSPDDNDYNDDDFTVNCTTTGSDKASIKLVS